MPAKGARMTVSSICCCQVATVRSATVMSDCCCSSEFRFEGQRGCFGMLEVGLSGDIMLHQVALALQFLLRFLDAHPGFGQRILGRCQLRFGQLQAGFDVRIVQARQDLVLGHFHALLNQHFGDLAGYLRRDGRRPAGIDVAGRVEHGPFGAGGGHLPGSDRMHLRWPWFV